MWLRMIPIKREGYKDVWAFESMLYPGHYMQDPRKNDVGKFELVKVDNILALPADDEYLYFNVPKYHD
jgi:hypothetical protein